MNLSQTIAELEKQAEQYTQAADTLRALQQREGSNGATLGRKPGRPAGSGAGANAKSGAKDSGSKPGRKKRARFSPETRAKISAALKARHAEKKAARNAA